jgi:hypothetical protein
LHLLQKHYICTMELIQETSKRNRYKHKIGIFQCSWCDNHFEASISDVTLGRVKSCGCRRVMGSLPNEINGIEVIKELPLKMGGKTRRRMALFQCPKCPNTFEYCVSMVKTGGKKHCGCVKPEKKIRPVKENKKIKHPLYRIWNGIKSRCRDANSQYYGLRGIKVCDRWLNSFELFCEDMGERPSNQHTIDRIDCNGNYEPSNCRWATKQTQSINTRLRKDNTTGYKGVVYEHTSGQYRARVKSNGKLLDAGRYNTLDEAVKGRNEYIVKHNLPHYIQSIDCQGTVL